MPSDHAPDVAADLKSLFVDIDSGLAALGLKRGRVQRGWSYKSGRALICRIDPKNTKGCLRVCVGEEVELAAPAVLRGDYRQTGWLVVWPQHQDVALSYILASARRRGLGAADGASRA